MQGSKFTLNFSNLKRQTGNYFDYSIPPLPLPPHEKVIQHAELLPSEYMSTFIFFPSPYIKYNLSMKQLNVKELSSHFEFPASHRHMKISMVFLPSGASPDVRYSKAPVYETVAPGS